MNVPLANDAALAQAVPSAITKLDVLVRSVSYLAQNIFSFEFVDPNGDALPGFTAGSHIDVHLPDGLIRQYSLCNDQIETHRYVVAVLREPNGRGGSMAMADALRPGTKVTISVPRSNFKLAPGAKRHVFLAGGIGITPIMSMITAVRAQSQDFHLYYCSRSAERTAFLDVLRPLIGQGLVTVHHDGGDLTKSLDLNSVLREQPPGAHLYYCGPNGMLNAAEAASSHWAEGTTHCERFSADPAAVAPIQDDSDKPFEVALAKTGKTLSVPVGKSIVQVLKENGIIVDTSCEQGYCGTCMTRYLDGEPLHRDSVLDEEDRAEFMMVCCSRAKSARITLDL